MYLVPLEAKRGHHPVKLKLFKVHFLLAVTPLEQSGPRLCVPYSSVDLDVTVS